MKGWPAVLGVVLALGCAGRMARVSKALQLYEDSLVVSAAPESSDVTIGATVPFHVVLTNRGSRELSGCVGPNSRIHFLAKPITVREGRSPVGASGQIVDHPGCEKRFVVRAGETFSWNEDVTVPDIGVGRAEATPSIQVIYPHDCDEYGCYGTDIKAAPVVLELRRHNP